MQNRNKTKVYSHHFLVMGLVFLAMACGGKEKHGEDLQQAYKLHSEATHIRKQIADELSKLNDDTDSTFVRTYEQDLDSIKLLLSDWDEQVVEIPGFDEEDHEHEGHDHSEKVEQELTPEQHLEVQQYLLTEIRKIAERINQID